jgi:ABC-type transporter Mla subunit MlaD
MTNPSDQGWDTTVRGLESLGGMVVNAVEAYDRTLNLSQGWFEGILATYKEQAEGYAAMLRSVDASLRALEQVIEGQAKITKALGESLDASRQVVTAATSSHQHSTERVENFVEEVLAVLNSQLQALKTQVDIGQAMFSNPLSTQSAMFLKMVQDWSDAYSRMLSATPPFRPSAHD